MIIIKSINELIHIENRYSQIWAIAHSCKSEQLPVSAKQVKELAPSDDLFACYRKAVHNEEFDEAWFDNIYVPRFLTDLAGNIRANELLKVLCEESKIEETIILACFCSNPRMCHRSIVANLLYCMGANVKGYDNRCWIHYRMFKDYSDDFG